MRPLLLALLLLLAASPRPADANCNVIPGTTNTFRAALGEADRPFAMPGDFVELRVRPAVCDAASRGVADHDGNGTIDGRDVLVTVLFEPPGGGAQNAVVLVNIPDYRLLVVEGRATVLAMAVAAGRPDWRTPPIDDHIERIVVNPACEVPASIVEAELAPRAARDPTGAAPIPSTPRTTTARTRE